MNAVQLIGCLARDPEAGETAAGRSVATIRVDWNRRRPKVQAAGRGKLRRVPWPQSSGSRSNDNQEEGATPALGS